MYLKDTSFPSYKVLTAKDGNAGLKTALTELPDLIISDVIMSGTDGFQVVKKIKDNPDNPDLKVEKLAEEVGFSSQTHLTYRTKIIRFVTFQYIQNNTKHKISYFAYNI